MNVAATCDLYITAKTAKCRCSIEGLRHSWATLAIASCASPRRSPYRRVDYCLTKTHVA